MPHTAMSTKTEKSVACAVCGCLDAKCGGTGTKQTVGTAQEWTAEDLALIASTTGTGAEDVREWCQARGKRSVCKFVSRVASTRSALPGQGGLTKPFKHIKAAANGSGHQDPKHAHTEAQHWTNEQLARYAADTGCPFTPAHLKALNWSLTLCTVLCPKNQLPPQTGAVCRVHCVQKIRWAVFHVQHFKPALFGPSGRSLPAQMLRLPPHEATVPIAKVQEQVMCRMLHPTERQRHPPSQAERVALARLGTARTACGMPGCPLCSLPAAVATAPKFERCQGGRTALQGHRSRRHAAPGDQHPRQEVLCRRSGAGRLRAYDG